MSKHIKQSEALNQGGPSAPNQVEAYLSLESDKKIVLNCADSTIVRRTLSTLTENPQGPSEDEVASAYFKMWFIGRGLSDASLASKGNKKPDTEIVTRVMGPKVGYVTTPIILLQCSLVLLADRNNLLKGGVFTPGIVFGPMDLEGRLQENGISFDFISKKAIST
ncbi:hypothetical protein CDL12_12538 [Handroanthus impetiginosus]|uniref:Uncharacterized protein n=1 Tax=Handroanthus impetiginosus TaxID=429701 RepID=A0A2G9HBF2_9LAMI|nr:hypothetical protein CDL12_12538 [Handroanthus impetiginosus]